MILLKIRDAVAESRHRGSSNGRRTNRLRMLNSLKSFLLRFMSSTDIMRQLRLRSRIEILPIHQLSNILLGNLFAITGGICLDQTGLERLLTDELSLMIKTLNMILRLNPSLQTRNGRHDWRDYSIISERGWSIPWSKVSR